MRYRFVFILGAIAAIHFFIFFPLNFLKNISVANAEQLKLFEAVMCEEIFSDAPRNPTTIFSASKEKAVSFSIFDPVPQQSVIYHNWYHRDVPVVVNNRLLRYRINRLFTTTGIIVMYRARRYG